MTIDGYLKGIVSYDYMYIYLVSKMTLSSTVIKMIFSKVFPYKHIHWQGPPRITNWSLFAGSDRQCYIRRHRFIDPFVQETNI